ncbi:MAG TPA: hypothetical protein VFX98_01830 [Longimicrobiaceae bacterium]|nr:hypothetical protein [Longimicrobiaceae bacterium]
MSGGALRGRTLFLSASAPSPKRAEEFRRVQDAPREIEQAVVSLAQAVFAEEGRLVFGGHPSIAPLVEFVARQHAPGDAPPEPPLVTVHQLDVFRERGEIPAATVEMERMGHAQIHWHRTLEHERDRRWREDEVKFRDSLRPMRRAMIQDRSVLGMVAVGGMEGVFDEAEMFAELRPELLPVFVLARTGGAAALLAGEGRNPASKLRIPEVPVRVVDREVLGGAMPEVEGPDGEPLRVPLRYTPYTLVMQEIVRRLAERAAPA